MGVKCDFQRKMVKSSTLCGANNECAAGCLDHVLCDDIQLVNKQDCGLT
jgi:hypothetical protein